MPSGQPARRWRYEPAQSSRSICSQVCACFLSPRSAKMLKSIRGEIEIQIEVPQFGEGGQRRGNFHFSSQATIAEKAALLAQV